MIEPLMNDRLNRDFGSIFGINNGHFSHGTESNERSVPQWKRNRTAAMSFGRLKFQHTTPCHTCGGLDRWTRRFIEGTKINKCAGCS